LPRGYEEFWEKELSKRKPWVEFEQKLH
jgi:hypothetical protein